MADDSATINEVLDEFLAAQKERLAPSTYGRYEDVIELFRRSLDGYAYEGLSSSERGFWERRFERDEQEGSFCNSFGADKIPENVGQFLNWFMIRKVMAGEDRMRAAATVMKKLAGWLEERGWIDAEAAADAREQGADAARDLPRAVELTDVLWDASEEPLDEPVLEEWDDDLGTISRVEPGRLWFRDFRSGDEVGPVIVPARASELAEPGWDVSALLLGRTRGGWRILELGSVYPR